MDGSTVPILSILPIGDHYTMGHEEAAHAAAMLGSRYAVPMHYGTMPVLTGSPQTFRELVEKHTGGKTKVIIPEPGQDFSDLVI
jgi:L-ascorbate metabolism protein UlaG (beta-lactamase superfamily)